MNTPPTQNCESAERIAEVRCKDGLHMRPAMQFVDRAGNFAGEVTVSKGDFSVDGKSIMHVTMLAATAGTKLKIKVVGPDAQQAVDALAAIIEHETIDDNE